MKSKTRTSTITKHEDGSEDIHWKQQTARMVVSATTIQTRETSIHWRQSPTTTSPENDQQNCISSYTNHDQGPSSPVQNGEDNSSYSSENEANNLSPPQETSQSSASEDMAANLFPISGSSMLPQCMDYTDENDSFQNSPSSFHDDDSYRSGKGANSGGKSKLHKCKHCNFSTTNKQESWLHAAIHMKPEKILRCPNCPFVTEYKHHLDFHLWNHQGMKPYKCDKCEYNCVNKSMLKSHLKSHSNVYQYRCANCSYRTKYCHSLKIHLRKYKHEPGMVLDAEGNPNPNPVIDVYGNRRGPKQKPKKQELVKPIPTTNGGPMNAFQNFSWINILNEGPRMPTLLPHNMTPPFIAELPKIDITSSQESDTLNNNLKITNNNSNLFNNHNDSGIHVDMMKKVTISDEDEEEEEHTFHLQNNILEEPKSVSPHSTFYYENQPITVLKPEFGVEEEVPLNLSVSHATTSQSHDSNVTPVVKNRRKGVAVKLKRAYTSEDEEYNKPITKKGEIFDISVTSTPNLVETTEKEKEADKELLIQLNQKQNFFYCEFCEITFYNQIIFTMHRGYHGYSDPFTCNRCGVKTEDSTKFYAHLLSSAHS